MNKIGVTEAGDGGLDFELSGSSYQRKGCLCPSNKYELLKNKKQCPHGCLYCYWR